MIITFSNTFFFQYSFCWMHNFTVISLHPLFDHMCLQEPDHCRPIRWNDRGTVRWKHQESFKIWKRSWRNRHTDRGRVEHRSARSAGCRLERNVWFVFICLRLKVCKNDFQKGECPVVCKQTTNERKNYNYQYCHIWLRLVRENHKCQYLLRL